MSNQTFIESIKDGAIRAQQEHGICASLTVAQAILESGWGQHAPGNNLFGIKWTDGCGYESQTLATKECYNGVWQTIEDKFRAYNSLADSVYDHAMFLVQNSRYSNLLGVKDYKEACRLVQEDGYATDPNYANQLIQIIEENNLQQYDNVEEEKKVENIVIYNHGADQGAAEYLADYLNCPTISNSRKFDFSCVKNVYAVGGKSEQYTSYVKQVISGVDEYETMKEVLHFCGKLW